jgi:hypothetical protein
MIALAIVVAVLYVFWRIQKRFPRTTVAIGAVIIKMVKNGLYTKGLLVVIIKKHAFHKGHLIDILCNLGDKECHIVHEKVFEKLKEHNALTRREKEDILFFYQEMPHEHYRKILRLIDANQNKQLCNTS